MELPKNITQIGESDRNCKVYVEDYVISYIKQLNLPAQDKDMAVALYGIRKEEKDISYIFLYGACKLDFLQRESRHLSQAQQQEIEKLRKKYFQEYEFMGYRLLNGEMVEGFHIYENGSCRYVQGYAQFYEKNDSMLAYMLDTRQEEAPPEEVNQEKYNIVKQRQEERRAKAEEQNSPSPQKESRQVHKSYHASPSLEEKKKPVQEGNLRNFRFSAVAVFALLCVVGLAALNGSEKVDELQVAARQMIDEMTEQKLPDTLEASNPTAQVDTIVTEDKLADAILKENENVAAQSNDVVAATETPAQVQPSTGTDAQTLIQTQTAPPQATASPAETPAPTPEPTPEPTPVPTDPPAASQKPEAAQTSGPVGYVIQKGDTLIGISIRQYGSDGKVSEICSLNDISDPDDIKVGQKILLP